MQTILVTGGAGFVGSHTCKALSRAGYRPVTFDSLEHGHEWAVKWGPLETGDLGNPADLRRVFETWRPAAVLHFAAYAYVGESVTDPLKYYRNNIGGAVNLLAACQEFGCRKIVFSSTCATFGTPSQVPIREDMPQNPINPYGYSKLVVERMLKDAEIAHGIRHVVLRYFNAAGSDPDAEIGEAHNPETHLIPLVLMAARSRQDTVRIFGNDYPTPDGTCVRDYIHVNDLAAAHVAALEWLAGDNPSNDFNLGNGQGTSVAEVIRACERVTGFRIAAEVHPRRAGDPPALISDSSKARRLLNWTPQFPGIDDQIAHAWAWLKKANSVG